MAPDYASMSDEQLMQLAGVTPTPAAIDYSKLSDDQLLKLANIEPQGWNVGESLKNLLSGAIEGTVGTAALAADAFKPMNFFDPRGPFSLSRQAQESLDPVLAAKDPQYRYARTIGQFIGPGASLGAGGKIARALGYAAPNMAAITSAPALISDAAAGIGAQTAEDMTGDTAIAPLVGAVAGGGLTRALIDVAPNTYALFKSAKPDEIKGSAALALKEITGLDDVQISEAIKRRPQDALGKYMTTAELTDNAGMAQIEKSLSSADEGAIIYNDRILERQRARDGLLDSLTPAQPMTKEGLGSILMDKASSVYKDLTGEADNIWAKVPRNNSININNEQKALRSIINKRQGGLEPSSKVQKLVDQMFPVNSDGVRIPYKTSGALQDIRSDALTLMRDANITPYESRILNKIQQGIDSAMSKGLKGEDYKIWEEARKATATTQDIFSRSRAGGALTAEYARPNNALANALKGDAQSIKELKAAVRNDPQIMEQVKRGIIDSIPRDADGVLTPAKMKNFINANEGGLKELLGKDHFRQVRRILSDLQSEARVMKNAYRSSIGNSVTSQRGTVAGAIQDVLMESVVPGSGVLSRVAETVKQSAGIKNSKQVQELLFKASLEPEFALELSKTPTTKRVFDLLDRLKIMAQNIGASAGTAGIIEASRTQEGFNEQTRGAKRQARSELKARSLLEESMTPAQGQITAPSPTMFEERSGNETINQQPYTDRPVSYDPSQLKSYIQSQDPLIQAVIRVESGGNPQARSKAGAYGLMQLMPGTAKELGVNPADPAQNIQGGTEYLSQMLKKFRDPKLALAAYNAGPGRVERAMKAAQKNRQAPTWENVRKYLPEETKQYPGKILAQYRQITRG